MDAHKILCTGGPRETTTYKAGGDSRQINQPSANQNEGQPGASVAPNALVPCIIQVSALPYILLGLPAILHPLEDGVTSASIYQGIRDACAAQEEKRKADFRDGVLAALRAAEEPDPFASIRGAFDLSAPNSRQWKTSLVLPDAERCALLKTPPESPTSASAWTFACLFPSAGDGYEGMVKSVGSVLNLPYQPDEKAANIN
jgi:hypothetical protein